MTDHDYNDVPDTRQAWLILLCSAVIAFLAAQAIEAFGQGREEDRPTLQLLGQVREPTPFERALPGGIRLVGPGGELRFALQSDGTIDFGEGATIDFADIRYRAGRRVAFAVVRAEGRRFLVPLYELPEGER